MSTKEERVQSLIEIILFLIVTFSLFVLFQSFWELEIKLWNRVPYKVDAWTYSTPFFSSESSVAYIMSLTRLTILITAVTAVFAVAAVLFSWRIWRQSRNIKLQVFTLLVTLSIFAIIFWAWRSLLLIPAWNGKNLSEPTGKIRWIDMEMPAITSNDWKFMNIALPGVDVAGRIQFLEYLLVAAAVFSAIAFMFCIVALGNMILENRAAREQEPVITKDIKKDVTYWIRTSMFYIFMISFFIYTVTPVVYTFLLSISNAADLRANSFIPGRPLDNFVVNYSSVIFILQKSSSEATFSTSFGISLGLGIGTAIGGLVIALPAAYAISRFKFKGRGFAQFLVLATQMFPGIILLIPQFILWKNFGFFSHGNTVKILSLLLAYFVGAIAYNVWMMKGYFDTIPYDLEEAALIDGANEFSAFVKIALPLAAPGMIAVGIFTFLGAWNEFALAQMFIGEKNPISPLPLMFYQYQNDAAPDNPPYFELLSAFSILAALPIMIVFMSLQKLLTGGLTSGGVK